MFRIVGAFGLHASEPVKSCFVCRGIVTGIVNVVIGVCTAVPATALGIETSNHVLFHIPP